MDDDGKAFKSISVKIRSLRGERGRKQVILIISFFPFVKNSKEIQVQKKSFIKLKFKQSFIVQVSFHETRNEKAIYFRFKNKV